MPFENALPQALPMQVSPVGNALSSLYDNQIKAAQAQYAPAQNQANAFLTQQQATWLPYQYKMQALTNPTLWAMAAADKTGGMQNQLMSLMSNPMSTGGAQAPRPAGISLLGTLMNKIGAGSSQPANALLQGGMAPQAQQGGENAMMAQPGAAQGAPGQANAGNTNAPDTDISRLGQGQSLNGINPFSTSSAQAAALNTTATTEAAAQQDMWKERFNKSIDTANAQQQNINLSSKLKDAYSHLSTYERGKALGHLPSFSTAAQDTDAAQAALADSVAKAQQEGHITARDRDIYSAMKPGRTMTPESLDHQINFIQGMGERMEEKPAFYIAAKKQGLSPEQADAVWVNYAKQKPFFDPKTNSINEDNIGAWQDYLTPQKVSEALNPPKQKSMASQTSSSAQEFKLPAFNNKAEFQVWFKQQPPEVQKQAMAHLGG